MIKNSGQPTTSALLKENESLKQEIYRLNSLFESIKVSSGQDSNSIPPVLANNETGELDHDVLTSLQLVSRLDELSSKIPKKLPQKKKKAAVSKARTKKNQKKRPLLKKDLTSSTGDNKLDSTLLPSKEPVTQQPQPEVVSDPELSLREKMAQIKLAALTFLDTFVPITTYDMDSAVELIRKETLCGGPSGSIRNDPFFVCNLGAAVEKYIEWACCMPKVEPFYAVKSNPDINLVRLLHFLGAGFDCASQAELEAALSVGAHPDNIIFANPCKGIKHIEYSRDHDVEKMTFDCVWELEKIMNLYPKAQLVLRLLPDDSKSTMPFGKKFGCHIDDVPEIISRCKELGANLVGVSFHVGSGCFSAQAYVDAVVLARQVFDLAEKEGYTMNLLDIGGGFPGENSVTLSIADIGKALSPVLEELFPPSVRIIAEPGRFFCTSTATLVLNVNSRKFKTFENADGTSRTEAKYYMSDGLYGSFNSIVFDHARPLPQVLKETTESDPHYKSCLFGPTCDSIDVICQELMLPELDIGDWLYFPDMGAYTIAAASTFNGFEKPEVKYFMFL